MWCITAKREFVNMDSFDCVKVEGKAVIGVSGAAKTVLLDCGDEAKAALLFSSITERMGQGAKTFDAQVALNTKLAEQKQALDAQENAKRVQAEAKARSEALLNKPITDKKA